MLHLESIPKPDDAADALAIALCHGFTGRFGNMYAVGNMTRGKGKNVEPASAYQALMQQGAKKSKKTERKTKKTASTPKAVVAVKKTPVRQTKSTAEEIAASVIMNMKD